MQAQAAHASTSFKIVSLFLVFSIFLQFYVIQTYTSNFLTFALAYTLKSFKLFQSCFYFYMLSEHGHNGHGDKDHDGHEGPEDKKKIEQEDVISKPSK